MEDTNVNVGDCYLGLSNRTLLQISITLFFVIDNIHDIFKMFQFKSVRVPYQLPYFLSNMLSSQCFIQKILISKKLI